MSTSLTEIQLYANNVYSTLSSSISASDTVIPLQPGDGAKFPYPDVGEFFLATLDSEDGIEVVKCTSRIGDSLTVQRGQEDTAASAFPAGTMIQVRVTKGTLERFSRLTDRLYDIASVDDLPKAGDAAGNSFVCQSSDEEGNPIVAVKREDLWRFMTHSTNVSSGTVTSAGTTYVITSASTAIEATAYTGRYVVQFTTGALKGYARLVTGAAAGRIDWTKAFDVAPSPGDQLSIYVSDAYQFSLMANLGLVVYRGEFGLGGRNPLWPYPTMNVTSVSTGFYQADSTVVSNLPVAGIFGIMVDAGNAGVSFRQMAWNRNTGTTYVRHYPGVSVGWQPWRKVYDEGSVALPVQDVLDSTSVDGMHEALGLGSAATKDVGFMPGNVLQVGHYGLGAGQNGLSNYANDMDSLTRATGFYYTTSSATGFTQPVGVGKGGSILHMQRIQAGSTAQAFQLFVSDTTGRMFYRNAYNNVWSAWKEFYHSGNVSDSVKAFMAATTPQEARESIGAHDASNLSTGTVPAARLPDATQSTKGVTQFATVAEALTLGTPVVKSVQPSVMQEAIKRQFNPQGGEYLADWNTITEPGMFPYVLNGEALNGPFYPNGEPGAATFFCMVYKAGTSSTANLIQLAYAAEDPFQDEFSNNHMLYRTRTNGVWSWWVSIVDVFNFQGIFNLLNPSGPGFMHMPNYMTFQWGTGVTANSAGVESAALYFPVAYDQLQVVVATHGRGATGHAGISVGSSSNSWFKVFSDKIGPIGYNWIAIGVIDR